MQHKPYTKAVAAEKYTVKKRDMGNPMFVHCTKCIKELPPDTSPAEYVETYMTTYTPDELPGERIVVLWCKRHQIQVWDSRHLVPRL